MCSLESIFNELKIDRLLNNTDFKSWILEETSDPKESSHRLAYEDTPDAGKETSNSIFFINPFSASSLNCEKDNIKFKNHLQGFRARLTSLNLHDMHDFYHCFYEFPTSFSDLQSLTLSSSTLPLNLCQRLFSLSNLNSLTVSNCYLLQSKENPIQLEFSKSIQQLQLKGCMLKYVENDTDSIPYLIGEGIKLEVEPISLYPHYLPKLASFTLSGGLECEQSLVDFLVLNPQIKKICLDSNNLKLNIIEKLSLMEDLTHLTIIKDEFKLPSTDEETLSQLNSVKYLDIHIPVESTSLNGLPVILPNVSTLVAKFDLVKYNGLDDPIKAINSKLKDFMPNFINCRMLVVVFDWKNVKSYENMLETSPESMETPPKSMETQLVETIKTHVKDNLIKFKNLKFIKFRLKNTPKTFESNLVFEIANNWKFKRHSRALMFYKN